MDFGVVRRRSGGSRSITFRFTRPDIAVLKADGPTDQGS